MDARQPNAERRRGLLSHCGDFLRWLLLLALVTVAIGSFALYFVHSRLDEEIRIYVESKFRANYPQLIVQVRSAHRVEGSGIEVRGLRLDERGPDGRSIPLAFVEELFAECGTDLSELAAGHTQARRLVFRGVKLHATRRANGTWNVAQLWPPPKFGAGPPPIVIEGGRVELADYTDKQPTLFTLQDVHLQLTPIMAPEVAAELHVPPPLRVQGSCAADSVGRVSVAGTIHPGKQEYELTGSVDALDLNARAIDALPRNIARLFAAVRGATGKAQFHYQIASTAGGFSALPNYAIAGNFAGRFEDVRLPQPLMNVNLPFEINNGGLVINDARAQAGTTNLQLSASATCLQVGQPYSLRFLRLRAERLVLDDQLAKSLPADWRSAWDKLAPRGTIDADITVQYDGQRAKTSATVDLLDTSFAFYKFPYRVHQARGQIRYRDDIVDLDGIRAAANGHPVRIEGRLAHPAVKPVGDVTITVEEPIEIDEQLISAVQGNGQRVIRELNPQGPIRVAARFVRSDPSQPSKLHIDLELLNCSMRYKRFPYPLHNVTGHMTLDQGQWTFTDLAATNDSGVVLCSGHWTPRPDSGSDLVLDFSATDVPLEDELREALSPGAQQAWRSINPHGSIDHLTIGVRYDSRSRDLSIDVTARERSATQNVEGRSITVKPAWLPYQLDNVTGIVHFGDGTFTLEKVQGMHGPTNVELTGSFEQLPDEQWRLRLSQLHVDRLHSNHELIAALPEGLANAVSRLNLEGPVHVSGSCGLDGINGIARPIASDWDLDFDIEGGRLNSLVPLEDIRGAMHLRGRLDPNGLYSRGQIEIDSLFYKGVQFTQISGPLSIDDKHVAFGEMIRRQPGEAVARPMRAEALTGIINGSARLWLDEAGWFELEGELFEGDLTTILQEFSNKEHDVSGKTYASVRLTGTNKGTYTIRGGGQVQLRDADIYQLPVMVRMLKLLRIKRPNGTAFNSSDIEFHVEADRIYFDRIAFNGDAINLNGYGEMSLDRSLNLSFETSVIPRDSTAERLLGGVLRDASGLFQVNITGTLDDPQVVRGVNQTMQQVFPNAPEAARPILSRLPLPRLRR